MPRKTPKPSIKFSFSLPFAKVVVVLFFLNLAITAALFLMGDRLPPEVPMFYGRPSGPEQLAKREFLAGIPALATVLTVINAFLIRLVKNQFLQIVLVGLIATTTVLSTITIVKIVLLVGNIF